MLDYRRLEDEAQALQAEVLQIHGLKDQDGNIPAERRDELMRLMGRIEAIEDTAGKMRDAELEELRAIVARGGNVLQPGVSADEKARAGFRDWLRTGEPMDASLSSTDANGGFIVPEPAHADLVEKVRKADPIFGNATLFEMRGDVVMTLPYKSAHGVVANATETGARSEQNAPTFTAPTLTCYDYYTDQRATQQVLDSVSGFEDMLLGWIAEDIQEQAGADAVVGNGTTKIEGLFAGTSKYQTHLSGSAGALVNTNFLTVYFALPVKYRGNGAWVMNGGTLSVVTGMAYPNLSNTPLAQLGGDGTWTILGKRVLESDSAPAIGAANFPVAFGDIKRGYAVGVHRSTSILRDPYTAAPFVRFYAIARMGGCAWDYQAVRLLKSNNA